MPLDESPREPPEDRRNGDPEPPGKPGHPVVDEVEVLEELLAQVVEETQPKPAAWFADLRGRGAIVTGAIVTGGATGIGRATALELARHGVNVAFNYLEDGTGVKEEADRTALELRQLEVKVFRQECDIRDPDAVERFVAAAEERMGRIDILVNNAGIGRDRALWRMSDEEWDDVLATNLTGAFNMIRAVAPIFRAQQDGKIVNIASIHGLRPEFGLANYAASKAGLMGLTRSAAVELGPSNVNVNAVAPGYIRTTRLTDAVPAEILDSARERSVLGRLGDPQDVAHVVLFLCSEQARHITGAVIPVDGGHLL
ncbi:MAG: SDR family oxidoreductase [Gemmatimonadetes bacterium]|nr:SDR family oxidoreductase [Gemmatimonadota bacterium]NIQ58641.1 SDR family oxidoreductase [Gemmatimonadota bacterium]NIU78832.1 SDR family oxidoreductase [Gammaproteobacteria bacterium]NIX47632.1 SDR family oxidoreductase [Gemmatimonadota bacterium]NIY11994.1 SDR family oxidoreductase [Gemmatimonadota bacterium]